MLKNLFRIPDTFDPDDRRRRETLNVLLIVISIILLPICIYILYTSSCNCMNMSVIDKGLLQNVLIAVLLTSITFGILWVANRSPRVPSWLTGTVLLAFFLFTSLITDTTDELFNGRSVIGLALPITLAAVILHPRAAFV